MLMKKFLALVSLYVYDMFIEQDVINSTKKSFLIGKMYFIFKKGYKSYLTLSKASTKDL